MNVTALSTCESILVWSDHLLQISNERIQIFHKDRYCVHEACEGQWRATVRVQHQ